MQPSVGASLLKDRSSLANDEVAEFLSLPMVNNLTIVFPDYALSGFYQDVNAFDGFGYRVVLSSSHGFADNDSGSYKQLTDVGSRQTAALSPRTHAERSPPGDRRR